MTKADIKEIIQMMNVESYDLLCDNGIILHHSPEFPIGYFKTTSGAEYAVVLKPATINTQSVNRDNNGRIKERFTTTIVPMEYVQFLEVKATKGEGNKIIDGFVAKGAFTQDKAIEFKNSKKLFGVYERIDKK